ncbi:MAG: ankyrin repeat domain-containing protein [Nitrospira sp.]|nr:ankyrin repeat domain-containing protein [Nitrospira sp.]
MKPLLRPIDEDLFLATFLGDRAKVEKLLHDGANAQVEKEDGTTLLPLAIRRSHSEVVALLLDKGAAANQLSSGTTPLHLAARQRHRQIIEELLKHGADKSAMTIKGKRPVDLARDENHPEIIPLLEP